MGGAGSCSGLEAFLNIDDEGWGDAPTIFSTAFRKTV
jgi:hypothetical protein